MWTAGVLGLNISGPGESIFVLEELNFLKPRLKLHDHKIYYRRLKMQKTWSYKNYEIKEGLKPGSSQFRYFFVVSESGEKKCNY